LQRPADAGQIARSLGIEGRPADATDIRVAAKSLGLQAVSRKVTPERVRHLNGPFIAELTDGRYAVLLNTKGEKISAVLLPDPRPQRLSVDELQALWNGTAILIKIPLGLSDLPRRFDLAWFVP